MTLSPSCPGFLSTTMITGKFNLTSMGQSILFYGKNSSYHLAHTETESFALDTVQALYNYQPEDPEDLRLQAGDLVAVYAVQEDGWWSGEMMDPSRREPGRHNLPSNFVLRLDSRRELPEAVLFYGVCYSWFKRHECSLDLCLQFELYILINPPISSTWNSKRGISSRYSLLGTMAGGLGRW